MASAFGKTSVLVKVSVAAADSPTRSPPAPSPPQEKGGISNSIIYLIIGLTLLGLVLAAALVLALKLCRRRFVLRSQSIRLPDSDSSTIQLARNDAGSRSITIEHARVKKWSLVVLKKATDTFDEKHVIGRGQYATVYKAELDGKTMAIKRMIFDSNVRARSRRQRVMEEVEIIGRIHDRNILELEGYCLDGDEHILVYEFMVNGSLEDHLFGNRERLSWHQIEKILTGTASGIAYLHEGCRLKIIHRDIKPANILLDQDFKPRVADFGLLRVTNVSESHVSTRLAGTLGYVAPEYVETYQLGEHSDTFSFGVVMLVVIGQRNAMTNVNGYREHIADVAHRALSENNIMSFAAPHLVTEQNKDQVLRFINVALLCTQRASRRRPGMGHVVQMLKGNAEPASIDIRSGPSYVAFGDGGSAFISETATQSSLEEERCRTTYHFYRQ